eukprot:4321835-Prymnesium_polylepis.1
MSRVPARPDMGERFGASRCSSASAGAGEVRGSSVSRANLCGVAFASLPFSCSLGSSSCCCIRVD